MGAQMPQPAERNVTQRKIEKKYFEKNLTHTEIAPLCQFFKNPKNFWKTFGRAVRSKKIEKKLEYSLWKFLTGTPPPPLQSPGGLEFELSSLPSSEFIKVLALEIFNGYFLSKIKKN